MGGILRNKQRPTRQRKEKMKVAKLNAIVEAINNAPSGSYCGITDYTTKNNEVKSIIGKIGCSYEIAKDLAIKGIKEAIQNKDFGAYAVKGMGRWDESANEWNSRKRSLPLVEFNVVFEPDEVLEMAKEVLEGWENPKKKTNNNISLSEKERGIELNTETKNFNMSLMVEKEYFKEEKTKLLQEEKGKVQKATNPKTILKKKIQNRFLKKIKNFTIGEDNFKKITINKCVFE